MSKIIVVPTKEGKYKVLVDYIQQGIEYSSKPLAEKQANEIRNSK